MSNISVSFSRHPTSSGASDASRNQMKVSPLIRFRSGDSLDVLSLSLSSSCCVFYTASGGCCGQHTRVRIRPEYIPTLTFLSIFTHVSKTERKREKREEKKRCNNYESSVETKGEEEEEEGEGGFFSSPPPGWWFSGGGWDRDENLCIRVLREVFPFLLLLLLEKEGGCNHLAANREHLAL